MTGPAVNYTARVLHLLDHAERLRLDIERHRGAHRDSLVDSETGDKDKEAQRLIDATVTLLRTAAGLYES